MADVVRTGNDLELVAELAGRPPLETIQQYSLLTGDHRNANPVRVIPTRPLGLAWRGLRRGAVGSDAMRAVSNAPTDGACAGPT